MYVSVCAYVFVSEGVYLCLIVCVSVCETYMCLCVCPCRLCIDVKSHRQETVRVASGQRRIDSLTAINIMPGTHQGSPPILSTSFCKGLVSNCLNTILVIKVMTEVHTHCMKGIPPPLKTKPKPFASHGICQMFYTSKFYSRKTRKSRHFWQEIENVGCFTRLFNW